MELKGEKYNVVSNSSSLSSSQNTQVLQALEQFVSVYKEQNGIHEIYVPANIFSDKKLGVLESVVRYLKEKENLKYCEIAEILRRDERTIWVTYKSAITKSNKSSSLENSSLFIPINVFSNRSMGPLEVLVRYLKNVADLNFKEIAILLNRSYHNVWLSYKNSQKGGDIYG